MQKNCKSNEREDSSQQEGQNDMRSIMTCIEHCTSVYISYRVRSIVKEAHDGAKWKQRAWNNATLHAPIKGRWNDLAHPIYTRPNQPFGLHNRVVFVSKI